MNSEDVISAHEKVIHLLTEENNQLEKLRDELAINKKAAFTAGMSKVPGATMFHAKGEVIRSLIW